MGTPAHGAGTYRINGVLDHAVTQFDGVPDDRVAVTQEPGPPDYGRQVGQQGFDQLPGCNDLWIAEGREQPSITGQEERLKQCPQWRGIHLHLHSLKPSQAGV